MHSREAAMILFVSCRNNAMLGGNTLSLMPQRRHFDLVDAIPPRIPLRKRWLVKSIRQLQLIKLAPRETPHFHKRLLNITEHVRPKHPLEVCAQEMVVPVLIL